MTDLTSKTFYSIPFEKLPSVLQDFQNAKDHLRLRLINKRLTPDLYVGVPSNSFLDLAVIVVAEFEISTDELAFVRITDKLLSKWNVTFDEVYTYAWCEFKKEKTVIMEVSEILNMLYAQNIDLNSDELSMYVLTNQQSLYGAVRILDEEKIKDLAINIGADFLIIPSSIHEMLLIPMPIPLNDEECTQIIKQVNDEIVPEDERLANHAYVYRLSTGFDCLGGWCT